MLERLREAFERSENAFAVPAGTRVYAVGDIHGRADLLGYLHGMIADDLADRPPERAVVVYLGDYIDRGSDSRGVVETLIRRPLAGVEAVHLMGNHEEFMLRFLEDPGVGQSWILNGGDATLASYGVAPPAYAADLVEMDRARRSLVDNLPAEHLAFLRALGPCHVEGGYVFVHAGIRPGRPIAEQAREDLLWIRGPFLQSRADHGFCVVHGHTITPEVEVRRNRIGIDTGAFRSNRLTSLVLEGGSRRWLQT